MQTLVHLPDMTGIAVHGVAARHGNLLPLHLVVHIIRMVLAHIILPAGSTSCRTRHGIRDTILLAHRSYLLKALVGDDVITEHIHILLNDGLHILDEILHVLHEVRIDIILQSTYSIIVLYQSSTRRLLHAVEHMLTVAHRIEEGGQRTHILSAAAHIQQV